MQYIKFILAIGLLVAGFSILMYLRDVADYLFSKKSRAVLLINPTKRLASSFGSWRNIDDDMKDNWLYKIILFFIPYISIISVIVFILPHTSLGSENIGSLIEKKEYTTYYQAILTTESDKDYTVTVELAKEDGFLWPEEIYFGNGNHFEIWDSDGLEYWRDNGEIVFQKIYIGDKSGQDYALQILDSKTDSKIVETFLK